MKYKYLSLLSVGLLAMIGLIQPTYADWPMAGANPERTSRNSEEVEGKLEPVWYKKFEPYISHKTQLIAANNTIFVSAADGLYALDPESGNTKWQFNTELPLGHSPTYSNGKIYVGGLDHKLYALDANSGSKVWEFSGGRGFQTNPLVVEGKVIAGNRDGKVYAVNESSGTLAWEFETGGPVLFSPAYKDGVVYVASNDSYAYAINASNGGQVWKSSKLPGAGFHSWWPVIYNEYVILAGSNNYRTSVSPGADSQFTRKELMEIFPNYQSLAKGTAAGQIGNNWSNGNITLDISKSNSGSVSISNYFEDKPYRRTVLVLNRSNGSEKTFDYDGDGKQEYAPILWFGTHSGNRYPPAVGSDNILYMPTMYKSDTAIAGGGIVGWDLNSPHLRLVDRVWNAVDEPMGISFGGNVLYSNKCCDRTTRVVNISTPNSDFNGPAGTTSSTWNYYSYDLNTKIPGFNSEYYFPVASYTKPYGSYGNENGYYGFHGDTVAPITYNGKVYMHRSNAIIAFGSGGSTTESAKVTRASVTDSTIQIPTDQEVVAELESEIQKIISAGHLRPGYHSTGIFDLNAKAECGDELIDYWSTPGENIYILLAALPHLSPSTQTALRSYIQNEYQNYGPGTYTDIGWSSGVQREAFITPDDVQSMMSSYPAESTHSSYGTKGGWDVNPLNVYAAWKYALEFGNANEVYNSIKGRLDAPLSNAVLTEKPYLANAQIAGHIGYLELEKLAGQPETASVRSNLDQLISTRINTFSKDAPATNGTSGIYCRSLNVARNFMFMPPEVAQILKDSKKSEVQTALGEYEDQAPYWFVSKAETAYGEGSLTHLYDYNALFQAKALIVEESTDQLGKYIDVPSMERGDLYHIQNLVSYLGTEPCEASFPDICGSIFIDYIEGLHSAGVVNGYSDGYFRPSNPVTRDEMATFISRAFGFGVNTGGVAFPDAGSSNAHFESIQTLKNLGVIGGYSDGTYKPSNYVTRAEVTKFIANAFEKKGIVTTGSPTHSFPDIDSDTQSKFGGFINFVTNKESQGEKIMKGYSNGNFGPGDNLTREQMSKVVFLSMESL